MGAGTSFAWILRSLARGARSPREVGQLAPRGDTGGANMFKERRDDTRQDEPVDSLRELERVDPVELYATMRPDQRTAIGNEFVRYLTLAGDPMADQLRPKAVGEAIE